MRTMYGLLFLFFTMMAILIFLITGNISLLKQNAIIEAAGSTPQITNISPPSASGGTNTEITISGTGFGDTHGEVNFYYKRDQLSPGYLTYWSDTIIKVIVPSCGSDYIHSGSSGPVTVTTAAGITSSGYPFTITFSYGLRKWPGENPVIDFYVNPNTPDCEGEEIAVQNAAITWNAVPHKGFTFHYASTTNATQATQNGKNEIFWRDLGTSYPYAACSSIYDNNNSIFEVDLEFNDYYTWKTTDDSDIEATALHELGHWLSLKDLYGSVTDYPQDVDKTMYGIGEVIHHALHAEEIAGIQWIYPGVQDQYTINAYAGIGGNITPSGSLKVNRGASRTFTITPDPDYGIYEIIVDNDSLPPATSYTFDNITTNHTIFVTFTSDQHSLTINTDGQGSVTKNPDKTGYLHGETVQLTAIPADDWIFSRWVGDFPSSSLGDNPLSLIMDTDKNIMANFIQIPDQCALILKTAGTGSGSISKNPDRPSYAPGTSVELTANPATESIFFGWDIDLTLDQIDKTNPKTIIIRNSDRTITATFDLKQFSITGSVSGGHGRISPANQTANYGETASLNISPDSGYHIASITDNGNPTNPPISPYTISNITANHEVVVSFAADTIKNYHLDIQIAGQGNVTRIPEKESFKADEIVQLTASPNEGWYFDNWDSTDMNIAEPESPTLTFTMPAGNVTLIATFTENVPETYLLHVSKVGNGTISPAEGNHSYPEGTVVQVSASPDTGWSFSGWTGDIDSCGNTVTMDRDKNITASFIQNQTGGGGFPGPMGGGNSGGGGGGGSTSSIYLTQYMTGTPGVFTSEAFAKTYDGLLRLTFPKETKGQTEEGQALSYISLTPIPQDDQKLPLPEDGKVIGLTYKLEPEGTTFDPPVTITMLYKDDLVPEGIDEDNLAIGYWDNTNNKWISLEGCEPDSANSTITAPLTHFGTYAILGYPPKPVPANFMTSSLTIIPTEATPGEEIIISATVSNIGGISGSYNLSLKVNGSILESREMKLDAGNNQVVNFKVIPERVGDYFVDIDGKTGQYTVKEPEGKAAELTATPEVDNLPEPVITVESKIEATPVPAQARKTLPSQGATSTKFPIIWIIVVAAVIVILAVIFIITARGKSKI
jgi:hypothetical protein